MSQAIQEMSRTPLMDTQESIQFMRAARRSNKRRVYRSDQKLIDLGAKAIFSQAYRQEVKVSYVELDEAIAETGIIQEIDTKHKQLQINDSWISFYHISEISLNR
ncbi:hypothetical protein [Alkalicoccus daliensis]|uniref:Uncharacterized protein n=1 Tax=Alkalicoccus daliensis TaxID=745820 RepID=A0A1H0GXW5_9BACI|nr:hypothetical protein [Alkalicoccus daliensis]SDO11531.1 hypothetical protein SAMN04488053_10778 [Alkalicoccus daliensis]